MRIIPDNEKVALCKMCTLASVMRDCNRCPFNIGLLYKSFEQIKALPVELPPALRVNYLSRVKLLNEGV